MQRWTSINSKQHAIRIVERFFRQPHLARKAIQYKYHHPDSSHYRSVFDSIAVITEQQTLMSVDEAKNVFLYWQNRPLHRWKQHDYCVAILMLTGHWHPPEQMPGQCQQPPITHICKSLLHKHKTQKTSLR